MTQLGINLTYNLNPASGTALIHQDERWGEQIQTGEVPDRWGSRCDLNNTAKRWENRAACPYHLYAHHAHYLAPPRPYTHDVEYIEGQKAVLGACEPPTHLGGWCWGGARERRVHPPRAELRLSIGGWRGEPAEYRRLIFFSFFVKY